MATETGPFLKSATFIASTLPGVTLTNPDIFAAVVTLFI